MHRACAGVVELLAEVLHACVELSDPTPQRIRRVGRRSVRKHEQMRGRIGMGRRGNGERVREGGPEGNMIACTSRC